MIDRDDKYEGQEESEYHFSDEDINYEGDETQKAPAAAAATKRPDILDRLPKSRRVYVGVAVFFVAVFLIYKMISPASNAPPATELTPAAPMPDLSQQKQAITPAAPANNQLAAQQQTPAAMASAPMTAPAAATPPAAPAMAAIPTPTAPVMAAAPMASPTTPPANAFVNAQPLANQAPPALPNTVPMPSPPPAQANSQSISTNPMAMAPVPNMVVSSTPPSAPQPVVNSSGLMPSSQDQINALAAENSRLMNQLQVEYAQKLAVFSTQSKEMQDQLQSLNARVSGIETQLNQLLQTLNKQNPAAGPSSSNTMVPPPPGGANAIAPSAANAIVPISSGVETKLPFAVQAIIPGRAWLKSDNGDTLTVAEGDTLKGYGRITKIDPYDGTVLIDTGSKMLTLSYGG